MMMRIGEKSPIHDDPTLRASLAEELFHKGIALKWEDKQAAQAVYEELIHRFGQDPAPEIVEQVAKAHQNMAGH